MRKSIFAVLNVVIFASIIFINNLFAGISIQPYRVEGKIPAGKSYEGYFTIFNTAKKQTSVTVKWVDKTINPLKKDWLVFPETKVKIPAGKSIELKYNITIPPQSSGEYNARVIFEELVGGAMASIAMKYNFPIYIAVAGTEKYDYSIKNIEIANETQPNFKISMKNTGNVHIRPFGEITAVNKTDKSKYIIPFNPTKYGIIPEEEYDYQCKPEKGTLTDGKYSATLSISAGEGDLIKKLNKKFEFVVAGKTVTVTKQ